MTRRPLAARWRSATAGLVAASVAAFAIGSLLVVAAVDARTVSATYTAKVGLGAAKLTTYSDGAGSLYVNLKGLAAGTWSEQLWSGTCSRLGSRVAALPGLTVGTGHAVARTNALTAAQARGRALRIAHGSTILCATLRLAPNPAPKPTPTPSPTPAPTTLVVSVLGTRYSSLAVQPNTTTAGNPDGSLTVTTDPASSVKTVIGYTLPANAVPTGRTVTRIDVRVCASAGGEFYEVYGPPGSTPAEYEETQPADDGCWHFSGASGPDSTVFVKLRGASTVTIRNVDYTVRLG